MSEVSLTTNFKEINDWIGRMPTNFKTARREFQGLVIRSENRLQQAAPKGASSKLANSIPAYTKIEASGNDFKARIGSDLDYGVIAMETGRKPGKYPDSRPGKPLDRWAKQKGIPTFLVARAIAKKGTRRYYEKGPKLITQVENQINNFEMRKFQQRLLEIFG